ncbi:MAG: DPP IV N-terminal domain-containing protein [Gemmataceae bacterium]|nr:DPP IV N-terminal domain-containing protein [Gemmataceae bacterium]
MSRVMVVLAGIVAVTFAFAPACGQGDADAALLLFVSNRTGNADIFLAGSDGKKAVNLTNNKAEDTYPAWSPDGKKIAFTSDRNGAPQLYLMDADGGNVKRLTDHDGVDRAPSWSPDGKKIVFCRHLEGNPEILVMSAVGTGATNLTKHDAYDADPAWSPDGKKIAFASNRGDQGFDVFVMDPDGGNLKKITENPNPFGYIYPAWTPDSKKLAHTDLGENALHIFLSDAATGKRASLTKAPGLNTQGAFAPDGKRFAFLQVDADKEQNPVGNLLVMNADGTMTKEVLKREVPIEGGRPAWKPN